MREVERGRNYTTHRAAAKNTFPKDVPYKVRYVCKTWPALLTAPPRLL